MHMLQQPWEGMPRMTVGFTGRVLSGFAMNFMIEYRDNMREFMVLWSNKKEEGKSKGAKSPPTTNGETIIQDGEVHSVRCAV